MATTFETLQAEHQRLKEQLETGSLTSDFLRTVQNFIDRAQNDAAFVTAENDRQALNAIVQFWADFIQKQTGRQIPAIALKEAGEITDFQALQNQHRDLKSQLENYVPVTSLIGSIKEFMDQVEAKAHKVTAPQERDDLRTYVEYWSERIYQMLVAEDQNLVAQQNQPQTDASPVNFSSSVRSFIDRARTDARYVVNPTNREQLRSKLDYWASFIADENEVPVDTTLNAPIVLLNATAPSPRGVREEVKMQQTENRRGVNPRLTLAVLALLLCAGTALVAILIPEPPFICRLFPNAPGCPPEPPPCIHQGDISGQDFSNQNLNGCNFINAIAKGTNFSNSSLQEADFSSADLTGAILDNANLQGVDFRGANLVGAILTKANLLDALFDGETNLKDADLTASIISLPVELREIEQVKTALANKDSGQLKTLAIQQINVNNVGTARLAGGNEISLAATSSIKEVQNLREATFNEAILVGIDFSRVDLRNAKFSGAILTGANLSGGDDDHLHEIDLSGAFLTGVNLDSADLSDANLSQANLNGARLNDTIFTEADLPGAQLEGIISASNANFTQANLNEASLENSTLADTDFTKATMVNAELDGSDFSRAIFIEANLTNAKLEKSTLLDINASRVIMINANVKDANLTNANLMEAVLSWPVIEGFPLNDAGLNQVKALRDVSTGDNVSENICQSHFKGLRNLFNTIRNSEVNQIVNINDAIVDGANFQKTIWLGFNREQSNSDNFVRLKDLTEAIFIGARLQGANFSGVDLTGALFVGADLSEAKMEGATGTREIDFSFVNLRDTEDLEVGERWELVYEILSNPKEGRQFENYPKPLDLQCAILDGAFLVKANLQGALLTSSSLVDADIREANLDDVDAEGADFTEADLFQTTFRRAKLTKAKFNSANLREAILDDVIAIEAEFIAADLRESSLDRADLTNATLTEGVNLFKASLYQTNLSEADLTGAKLLGGVNLGGANLQQATLSNIDARGANLIQANMTQADLSGANLNGTFMQKANLEEATLNNASFDSANLQNANLEASVGEAVNFNKADLNGAVLIRVVWKAVNLTESSLVWADLTEARIENGSSLFKSDLAGANLSGALISGNGESLEQAANMSNANLAKSNLDGATFDLVNLSGANLFRANLTGANLGRTELSGADLTNATILGTVLPPNERLNGTTMPDRMLNRGG